MKRYLATVFSFLILVCGALAPLPAATVTADPLGIDYGAQAGLAGGDLRYTVASIINIALGLLGTIALVLIVYAGFKWMTAGGNEDAVSEAKKILSQAVIGLAIILSAYAITQFVVGSLYEATQGVKYGS